MHNKILKIISKSSLLCGLLFTVSCSNRGISLNNACENVCKISCHYKNMGYLGTGVAIGNNKILSCYHLFNHGLIEDIELQFFYENEKVNATLIAFNENKDLALLECNYKPFEIKGLSISETECKSGDVCYSVGYHKGKNLAVSEGIISRPNSDFDRFAFNPDYIEANITCYDGCSGGPLLNERFELLGICSKGCFDSDGNVVTEFGYYVSTENIQNFLDFNL